MVLIFQAREMQKASKPVSYFWITDMNAKREMPSEWSSVVVFMFDFEQGKMSFSIHVNRSKLKYASQIHRDVY